MNGKNNIIYFIFIFTCFPYICKLKFPEKKALSVCSSLQDYLKRFIIGLVFYFILYVCLRVFSCEFMWPQRQEVWSNSNSELPDVATGKQEKNMSLNTQPSIQPSTSIFSICLYLWFSLVVWQWNCKTLLLHMKMLFNNLNKNFHDTDIHIWIRGSKHFECDLI